MVNMKEIFCRILNSVILQQKYVLRLISKFHVAFCLSFPSWLTLAMASKNRTRNTGTTNHELELKPTNQTDIAREASVNWDWDWDRASVMFCQK